MAEIQTITLALPRWRLRAVCTAAAVIGLACRVGIVPERWIDPVGEALGGFLARGLTVKV